MAVGEPVGAVLSINSGADATIQPPSGTAWLIQSICFSGKVQIYLTDGTNDAILFESLGPGFIMPNINISPSTVYLKIHNYDSSTVKIAYTGMVSYPTS